MSKPLLHFAHANSFPTGAYRVYIEALEQHYTVQALDMHGHHPHYPVGDGWTMLAQELRDELKARYRQPVILVGHSLGGVLSLLVAKKHPELVRCVVLLDVPVLTGFRALMWRLIKLRGHGDRYTPAQFSERRRNVWADAEAAYQHFASKEKFAIWPPEVLRDYIACGMTPHPDGVTLRFKREIETAIYRSLPHNLGRVLHQFPVPVGYIGGSDSIESQRVGLTATKRLVGQHFQIIPGGHLFPMETPQAAAQATDQMIQGLLQAAAKNS